MATTTRTRPSIRGRAARATSAPSHTDEQPGRRPRLTLTRRAKIGLALTVACVTGWAHLSPLTAIVQVEVSGATTTRAKTILRAAGITPGTPLLATSTTRAQTQIEELGPIATAAVTRPDPLTVHIDVTERAPLWHAATARQVITVADDGIVMFRRPAPSSDTDALRADLPLLRIPSLPRLAPGESVVGSSLDGAHRVFELSDELAWLQVLSAELRAPDDLWITVGGDVLIRIGDAGDQLEEKLRSARAVLEATAPPAGASIDVRAPHAPVVRARG